MSRRFYAVEWEAGYRVAIHTFPTKADRAAFIDEDFYGRSALPYRHAEMLATDPLSPLQVLVHDADEIRTVRWGEK